MVPLFLVFFIVKWYGGAFFAFTIASFTDLIDGTIARFMKTHSQLGAFLDPLADKLLMITTFSCLVSVRAIPAWFLVLVILRDIMIMGGIGVLKILKIDVAYEPFWSSKFATLSQIVLGILSLGALWSPASAVGVYPLSDFAEGLMYITAVLIVVTGLQYIKKGIEILQGRYHGSVSRHRNPSV
ncbi:MAG: CDP-alcohol phosphatidyltransferase family protein [Deltaproteobacteria bacterium]|nr:CDP-alcohol phosphatidyltransferase family protein [Deltaproteobacteria bacterium]